MRELSGANLGPWNRLTVAMTGLAAVSTVLAAAFGWAILRPDPPQPVTRVPVLIPEGQSFNPIRGDMDLSDDGSLLVYRGVGDEGQPQLFLKRWDALEITPIDGTEGGDHPAISHDGQYVAFGQSGTIRVMPLQGGMPWTLGPGSVPVWSPDGAWIYYAGGVGRGLHSRPALGEGREKIITEVDSAAGETRHTHFDVLPGGGKIIYHVFGSFGSRIGVVDLDTGETKILGPGSYPRYSPSTGHLLFLDDAATLLAAPFDLERLELGAARRVAEQLTMITNGMGFFDVAETGRLVYLTGGELRTMTPEWVDRSGVATEIDSTWSVTGDPRNSSLSLSPGGNRLAISILSPDGSKYDIWVWQFDTGSLSPVTFEGPVNRRPSWFSRGDSLMFVSTRAGQSDLWTKRADGTGTAELIMDRGVGVTEGFYSPDGTLVFRESESDFGDIFWQPAGDSVPTELLTTDAGEHASVVSPDGRWLAYVSNDSGRNEVYVRPFTNELGPYWTVSLGGGTEPVWSHDGRELFYRNRANELVAVPYTGDPTFVKGQEEVLFSMADYLRGTGHPMYDVGPDDQRFVALRLQEDRGTSIQLILFEGWFEELLERMGN